MDRVRAPLIWAAFVLSCVVPVVAAASSPLLQWRDTVYIAAGFAGILAMVLLLAQPLLVGGYLPGLKSLRGRRMHRMFGIGLVIAVAVHVVGLWITSPPDVIDALLLASPTQFSIWGVIAMWAVLASALLASLRKRLRPRLRLWRLGHSTLAVVIVLGSVIHALLIVGTMETVSKVVLCALAIMATAKLLFDLRVFHRRT